MLLVSRELREGGEGSRLRRKRRWARWCGWLDIVAILRIPNDTISMIGKYIHDGQEQLNRPMYKP